MRLASSTLSIFILFLSPNAFAQETNSKPATEPAPAPETESPPPDPKPDPAPEAKADTPANPAPESKADTLTDPAPKSKADTKASGEQPTAKMDPSPPDSPLEKPSPRQGHFIAVGLHTSGAMAMDRDRGRRGPAFGVGYSVRLGERIAPWLDLGLAFAYASVEGDHPWQFGRLTVHTQFYLGEKYFLHAGFGFGAAGGGDPEDPGFDRGRFGDVYTAGAGMNFYLSNAQKSGGWILTPRITAEYGRDDVFPNSALWLGIEISRWWGVSRDQLDLDFDQAYQPSR